MLLAMGAGWTASPATAAKGTSSCHKDAPPVIHDGFRQPPVRYSRNGLLDTRLRASVGPVDINGEKILAMNYEGSFPGPTLVICKDDRLVVHFENDLTQPTNLHTHGFHVEPDANHDNVYLDLKPGERFTYEYKIPAGNKPGAFWYHPHRHMFVEPQIFGGLSGAIIQEGGLDEVPALKKVPQRWMVIQSTEVKDRAVLPVDQSVEADTPLYVNGVINPTVKIKPGQLQRWRIFNANDNRIVIFELPGKQRFHVLAEDANTLAATRTVRQLFIPPGSRREVLVRGPQPGKYAMRARPFSQFPGGNTAAGGGPTPNQTVLTLDSGQKAVKPPPLPHTALNKPVDLRKQQVQRKRTIVFDEKTVGANTDFLLNGHTFDPDRVITMKLNSLEEWKLVNKNTEWHTFHIHINDFQVVSVGGKKVPYVDYEDNVAIPPNETVVIRQKPVDFTGKFVFHCHVTFHEDHGMMAAVQVLKNPTAAQLRSSVSQDGAMTVSSSAYGSETEPAVASNAFAWLCDLGGHHEVAWRDEDEAGLSS